MQNVRCPLSNPHASHAQGPLGCDEAFATLDAALAFADEVELSDTDDALLRTCSESPSDRVEDGNDGTVANRNVDVRPSGRMRQRDELVYLRRVVEELEDQLLTLKKGSSEAQQESEEPLAFVWEELATRQYKQRQRAEVENVKLRSMLEEQVRVAKNLERLLKKRTMAELLLPSDTKRTRRSHDPMDNEAVFDDLMELLAEMYSHVDEIFADEEHFGCRKPTLSAYQARMDEAYGPVVEVFDSRITPFDMDNVSGAVWHHMSMQSFDQQAFPNELIEFSDQHFKVEYRSSLELPRLKGRFHGKIAGRKFVKDDRILLLWAAYVDPDHISGASMDGVYMRQKGWTMVRRAPPPYERSDGPVSVTQMYHIIIPEFSDDANQDEQRRKVGTLTNFVLSTVDFHLEAGRTLIENLLLDDGWKTPSPTSSPEANDSGEAIDSVS